MAFKRLSSEEMLQLSGAWVDPLSEARAAILATPDLAPAMPRVTAAHGALASLAQPVKADPRLAAISEEEGSLDARHDDVIRGGYGVLTGAAFLLGAGGRALLALRDSLFPDGLSSVQKTYRAEAGQAAQLAGRLTPALRAQLASIGVGPEDEKKTLEQFVDELIGLGAQLGALEDEKGRLQPAPGQASHQGGAALLAARNQWIRVANALVANGEAAQLDEATDKLIFGPLRAAEKAADRREGSRAGKKAAAEGAGQGAEAGAGAGDAAAGK